MGQPFVGGETGTHGCYLYLERFLNTFWLHQQALRAPWQHSSRLSAQGR